MRAFLIAAIALTGCSGPSPEIEKDSNDSAMIMAAQEMVRATLKDPASAEFRNDRIGQFQGKSVACGEVNANNSFGGKTGFKRYVAANELAVITEEGMEHAEFQKVWNEIC